MTTYSDAIRFLYSLRWFGAKFGLGNTFKLAALAGNPQNQLRFIHVAGTNGKGSTCAMLESIYRAAGLRVGLFTSPHLVAFGERIQVNRQCISEADITRLAAVAQAWLKEGWGASSGGPTQSGPIDEEHPTFFEVVTVMALRFFAEQKCDLVVWETGLGGRLDATNIVTPLTSVITNIQFDHQRYLGETLASIASEKAGIIKPGIPVICGIRAPEPLHVIEETAHRQHSPLTFVSVEDLHRPPLDAIRLPLLGQHQRMNAALTLAVVRSLAAQIPVSDDAIRTGLACVHWPGRLQLVTRPSGQKILLDGAHNVAGAESLVAAFREHFFSATTEARTGGFAVTRPGVEHPAAGAAGAPRPTLVLGILRDKDWPAMCEILAPLAGRVLLVPVHSERTAEPHGLAEVCQRANPRAQVFEFSSLEAALQDTTQDPFVIIAGSLYLIGEAMDLLHLSPAKMSQERQLNEWGG